MPIIADIHFDWRLALAAVEAGAAGVRINPGTMAEKHVREIVQAAADARVPAAPGEPDVPVAIRIGVNAGSLPRDLRERAETDAPGALVEAALRWAEQFEEWDFTSYKLSVKSSSVPDTIAAYRLLAAARRTRRCTWASPRPGTVWSGTHQERRRHRHAAGRRRGRHDPGEPHRRPGRGGQGRLADPGRAGPAAARPGGHLVPDLRPH